MNKLIASALMATGLVLGGTAVSVAVTDTPDPAPILGNPDAVLNPAPVKVPVVEEEPAVPVTEFTELPAPPPAPTPESPTVSTVPGPHGPIYPDDYVDPALRTVEQGGTRQIPTAPQLPEPAPTGEETPGVMPVPES